MSPVGRYTQGIDDLFERELGRMTALPHNELMTNDGKVVVTHGKGPGPVATSPMREAALKLLLHGHACCGAPSSASWGA